MQKDAKSSFYGDNDVPTGNFKEVNDPKYNDDLHGYYEIYKSSSPMEMAKVFFTVTLPLINLFFKKAIININFVELNPPQVLFLLQFQMKKSGNSDNYVLEYVPHRFYHQYARSTSKEEKEFSKKMFIEAISNEGVDRIFLNHIEVGKAHAFCARR